VRNEEVLLRVNEQRNILHEIRKRKANWIGHSWLLLFIKAADIKQCRQTFVAQGSFKDLQTLRGPQIDALP
jgi:hypothetical protein